MTFRIASAAILPLLLSTVSLASEEADIAVLSETEFGIGVGLMNLDFAEFDREDDKLVQESGWLPGIDATLRVDYHQLQARLVSSYYAGDIDYDGQTQSGAPIGSATDHRIWDISALAAYRIPYSATPQTRVYAGGGYRHWQRDIRSVGSISGLDETYHWWSVCTGLNMEWHLGTGRLILDGRLTRTLQPQVDVDFKHTFDSAELELGERWGWKTEAAWQHRFSARLSAELKTFYETLNLGRSDTETLTANGVPAGSVFQPRIENRNYGFLIDLRHHW